MVRNVLLGTFCLGFASFAAWPTGFIRAVAARSGGYGSCGAHGRRTAEHPTPKGLLLGNLCIEHKGTWGFIVMTRFSATVDGRQEARRSLSRGRWWHSHPNARAARILSCEVKSCSAGS